MLDKLKNLDKKSKMPDNERDAKMSVLDHIRREAAKDMGGKLKGIKKVGVIASDKQGLEEGLDKAKELVGDEPKELDGMEQDEEMSDDQPEEHMAEEMPMTPDELDKKIQELIALKEKMEKESN